MNNDTSRVKELRLFRIARGLTQTDLARLMGVTQQAVAKWEDTGQIPSGRIRDLAKHLRVSHDVLLVDDDPAQRERRVPIEVNEMFFSTQVVVDFEERSFHYCPREAEIPDFWRALQKGSFALLSAGPVQVLINTGSMRRIDFSEDPPLSSYEPYPTSPTDELKRDHRNAEANAPPQGGTDASAKGSEEEERQWYEHGEARVYIRGVPVPYVGHQTFFDDLLDRDAIPNEELADLADRFEHERDDTESIFDLFDHMNFIADMGDGVYEGHEELHPDQLCVFQSEDDDGVPQHTWVHNRDIQVIEVPTRLWELHRMAMDARLSLEKPSKGDERQRKKKKVK